MAVADQWILAIPHLIVLFFLWIGAAIVWVIAFFAILITGRYPRPLFDYTVGVLRWSWRVSYYAYGVLATDRYPPFTLADDPHYPVRLNIEYPERLSRGLVLVKWWLLVIPHLLILAAVAGGVGAHTGGLVGLLALFAGVALLFTGRYPKGIFDFLMGLHRWNLRVTAYTSLLTDVYPPFRLDQGEQEPEAEVESATSSAPGPVPAPAPGR